MNLYLREIEKDDKKEIEKLALEFQEANDEYPFEGVSDLKKVINNSFEEYFNGLEINKHIDEIYPTYAKQTTYVLADDSNHIYGLINLRHELKGKLMEVGGHIGYGIRPSERKKGYATLQLKLILDKLKELNINQALITCRENNIASKKTMEKFIGKKDTLVPSNHEGIMEYRYWIDVNKNLCMLNMKKDNTK
ncbi:MAG: GNAT family N-acetyltransferase [Clostridium sp.]|nr:GNAT family N-acetyltransferase [Clostridium sp.]